MNAEDFLKNLHCLDELFDLSDNAEYTEEQLIQFAERYHKAKLKELESKKELLNNIILN